MLILGEADNWEKIRTIVPDHVSIVTLPGVDAGVSGAILWDDIVTQNAGKKAVHQVQPDDVFTIPFTSGTTGMPKGVMQTHNSMIIPMERGAISSSLRAKPRFFSYLPLSHIAERQLIWIQSLIVCGSLTYNEGLPFLLRDMADTRPAVFFGVPRVWEQLRQGVLAKFGSQEALTEALGKDRAATQSLVQAALGFTDSDYLLAGGAPIPVSLISWFESLGIIICEGYGQTEAMALMVNTPEDRRNGSIGKPAKGVEIAISEEGELLCKADGLSPGYYKQPEKTAETFVDGWVHTGDKAKIDEDGFIYITGRVKDYFKTIHGKFVSPLPMEDAIAANRHIEQQCLLGRGYSKTVMVCVITKAAQNTDTAVVEAELRSEVQRINTEMENHARIGAIIISRNEWTIDNGILTPTMKLKRDKVEVLFGEQAELLARQSAEQNALLIEWL